MDHKLPIFRTSLQSYLQMKRERQSRNPYHLG